MAKTGLYVFTQDLRSDDNPLLLQATSQIHTLQLIYAEID